MRWPSPERLSYAKLLLEVVALTVLVAAVGLVVLRDPDRALQRLAGAAE